MRSRFCLHQHRLPRFVLPRSARTFRFRAAEYPSLGVSLCLLAQLSAEKQKEAAVILLRRELQQLDKEIATYQTSAETQRLIAKCVQKAALTRRSSCPDHLQTFTCCTTTTNARISGSRCLEISAPCAAVSRVTSTPSLAWSSPISSVRDLHSFLATGCYLLPTSCREACGGTRGAGRCPCRSPATRTVQM